MAGLRFIVVAGLPSLALQLGRALGDPPAHETKHEAKHVNCRDAMNAARTSVGLPDFEVPKTGESNLPVIEATSSELPSDDLARNQEEGDENNLTDAQKAADFLNSFCLDLSQGTTLGQNQPEGTYMYAPQSSGAEADCEAAVQHWRSAASNFPALPPVYAPKEKLYTVYKNVSFVGLFNTRKDPTMDCALITCNPDTTEEGGGANDSSGSQQQQPSPGGNQGPADSGGVSGGGQDFNKGDSEEPEAEESLTGGRRLEGQKTPIYSLLCLSSPPALQESEAPFTQQQWDKIRSSENSSTQLHVSAVFAIAAAALLYCFI